MLIVLAHDLDDNIIGSESGDQVRLGTFTIEGDVSVDSIYECNGEILVVSTHDKLTNKIRVMLHTAGLPPNKLIGMRFKKYGSVQSRPITNDNN
jgi:hypothetical protein